MKGQLIEPALPETVLGHAQDTAKKGFIARFGPSVGFWGGLLGLISTWLVVSDRWFPPSLDVIDITPVVVAKTRSQAYPSLGSDGISMIAHVRSREREVTVTALDASGDMFLTNSEYMFYLGRRVEGMSLDGLARQVERRRPFFRIAWSAWPSDSKVPVGIGPNEDRYIKFTFIDPSEFSGQIFSGPMDSYVGFKSERSLPRQKTSRPYLSHIFELKLDGIHVGVSPGFIRNEWQNGNVDLRLRAGRKLVKIVPSKLNKAITVSQKDWEEKNPQELSLNYPQ